MKDLTTNDLDLVFDKQNLECPAVVRERLFQGRNDISTDVWSAQNGYSWFVNRHDLYVWNQVSKLKILQFSLPTTGLPYSANSIAVFKKDRKAGVLAVSGEGCVRYWASLSSNQFFETTLDLSKEVVLSVQVLDHESSASPNSLLFLLSTTSGSVWILRADFQDGSLSSLKVGGRDEKGITRRLSSILFGSSKASMEASRVIRSLVYWRESEEVDQHNDSVYDPVALTLSSNTLQAFDIRGRALLWSYSNVTLMDRIESTLKRISMTEILDVRVYFLDIACFREGFLVLLGATHESANNITFFLAHLEGGDYTAPQLGWSSHIPISSSCSHHFDVMDESSFVGRVKLFVPQETGQSSTCERTDGVLIIYAGYVQSVYVPNDLGRINELPLNKMLLSSEKIIGESVDERYCYIMTNNGVVSALRLLPKGFEETGLHEVSFSDVIPDIVPENSKVDAFHKAYAHFAKKDIAKASALMKPLLSLKNNDLASLACKYLFNLIDQTDSDCLVENELRKKKRQCQGVILFLKQMDIYEKVRTGKVNVNGSPKSGAAFLAQMYEQVHIAVAIREWQTLTEDNDFALNMISDIVGKMYGVQGDADSIILGKLSNLSDVPRATLKAMEELSKKTCDERFVVLQIAADLFLAIATAITNCRRSTASVTLVPGEELWTGGSFADTFDALAITLLNELRSATLGRTESARLKDYAVRLTMFNLGERTGRIEGHPTLVALYTLGEEKIALDLAERFKDFKLLCRICLEYEKGLRDERLETYKKRFADDDFDIYLCQYLKNKNLNEELLEQKGERVDGFLSSLDTMRWRRELQNKQFDKAGRSLLSLADREEDDAWKQKAYYSLAKLSALCSENRDEEVISMCNEKLSQQAS
ncbi:unnamed protein product [Auanema sp. JU1783]|nr:unnamed protein product [Auanema sp. JU1783]